MNMAAEIDKYHRSRFVRSLSSNWNEQKKKGEYIYIYITCIKEKKRIKR